MQTDADTHGRRFSLRSLLLAILLIAGLLAVYVPYYHRSLESARQEAQRYATQRASWKLAQAAANDERDVEAVRRVLASVADTSAINFRFLMQDAIAHGNQPLLELFLDNGGALDLPRRNEDELLRNALNCDQPLDVRFAMTQLIIAQQRDMWNAATQARLLDEAIAHNATDQFEILSRLGIPLSPPAVVTFGSTTRLKSILQSDPHLIHATFRFDFPGMSRSDYPLLHLACKAGRIEKADLLLERGADIDAVDSVNGNTCIHLAALGGQAEMIERLLQHGADIDAGNHKGSTPLMIACEWGKLDCVRSLLAAGADGNLRDHDGRTAWQLASSWSNNFDGALQQLLLEANAAQ